jgi:hypothetical protein
VNTGNRVLWILIGALLVGVGALGVLAHTGHLPGTDPDLPLLSPDVRERWDSWGVWATVGTVAIGLGVLVLGLWLVRSQLRRRARADLPDLVLAASAGPAPTQPAPTQPAPTQPASIQPASIQPASIQSASAQPASTPSAPRAAWPVNPAHTPGPGATAASAPAGGTLRVDSAVLRRALTRDVRALPGVRHAEIRLSGGAAAPHLQVWLVVEPRAELAAVHRDLDLAVARFTETTGLPAHVIDVTVRIADRPPVRAR